MDTEISKINNKIWVEIIKIKRIKLIFCPEDPSKDKRRCPATIFAVSRIESVIGRMINLINSIKTIKGIKIVGVFDGVKWVNIWLVKLIQPNSIILIHKINDKDMQNLICLDDVKIYGKRPMKLFHRIKEKSLIKIIRLEKEKERIILNSLSKKFIIKFHSKGNRDGISQNW